MKKWMRIVLISIIPVLLLTIVSGVPGKSHTILITTTPDYCAGPDVVGYQCPDVSAKAEGVNRGFPISFLYGEVTIQKQDGFFKARILDDGAAKFAIQNFILDIIAWSIVVGAIILVRGKAAKYDGFSFFNL